MKKKSLRTAVSLAALVAGLVAVGACGESTPWLDLGKARNLHEIEMVSYELADTEDGGREFVGTVRITDKGARMKLPCLTIDVIFQQSQGDTRFDWRKRPHAVDLSSFEKGGSAEFEVIMPVPEGGEAVDNVVVALNRPLDTGLQALCEAAAVTGTSD